MVVLDPYLNSLLKTFPSTFHSTECEGADGDCDDDDLTVADVIVSDQMKLFSAAMVLPGRQIINFRRGNILKDTIKMLKMNELNIKKRPEIEFKGEDGIDASGPTREYFYLLIDAILHGEGGIHLFEGADDHRVPIHDTDLLISGLFFRVGQILAYSSLHGGTGLFGLSPAVINYIVYPNLDKVFGKLTLDDCPDPYVTDILQKVSFHCTPLFFESITLNSTHKLQIS